MINVISRNRGLTIMEKIPASPLLAGVIVAIIYYILAEWSYQFILEPMKNSVFWLPSGITAFLLIYFRHLPRVWPYLLGGLFVGEISVVLVHGTQFSTAFVWSLSNVLLGLTFAFLARVLLAPDFSFSRTKDVFSFFLIILLGVMPAALLGGLGSLFLHPHGNFIFFSLAWGVSDGLGIILLTPVLFTWITSPTPFRGNWKEAIILGLLLVSFSIFFYLSDFQVIYRSHFSFLIFFAAWGAIRFGPRGVSLTLLLIDITEVWATMNGTGTFANVDLPPYERLLTLQLMVANLGILLFILASALEEQNELRIHAEMATRMRDEFISIASHELKTPMTSLTMDIQMLNRLILSGKIQEESPEKLSRLTEIADREMRRLVYLVDDLLEVSRLTSGKIQLVKESIDLRTIVDEAIARLQPDLSTSGSSLIVSGTEKILGPWDERRIGQVVTNLLSNAIRYGNGNPIHVELLADSKFAYLTVKDEGRGILPEDQERIFYRYERAATDRDSHGLGLGLYIAQKIIDAHGGKITLKSDGKSSTSFRVTLPLK